MNTIGNQKCSQTMSELLIKSIYFCENKYWSLNRVFFSFVSCHLCTNNVVFISPVSKINNFPCDKSKGRKPFFLLVNKRLVMSRNEGMRNIFCFQKSTKTKHFIYSTNINVPTHLINKMPRRIHTNSLCWFFKSLLSIKLCFTPGMVKTKTL